MMLVTIAWYHVIRSCYLSNKAAVILHEILFSYDEVNRFCKLEKMFCVNNIFFTIIRSVTFSNVVRAY